MLDFVHASIYMKSRIGSQNVTNAPKCGQSLNGRTNERTDGQFDFIMPQILFGDIKIKIEIRFNTNIDIDLKKG